MSLFLYTDGSYSRSRDLGGWACIAVKDGYELWRIWGQAGATTNNRMELTAILRGLARCVTYSDNVIVVTDSRYCIGMLSLSDRIKPPSTNADLVLQARSLLRGGRISRRAGKHRSGTQFEWVKGHSGHQWNELADKLATAARDGKTLA